MNKSIYILIFSIFFIDYITAVKECQYGSVSSAPELFQFKLIKSISNKTFEYNGKVCRQAQDHLYEIEPFGFDAFNNKGIDSGEWFHGFIYFKYEYMAYKVRFYIHKDNSVIEYQLFDEIDPKEIGEEFGGTIESISEDTGGFKCPTPNSDSELRTKTPTQVSMEVRFTQTTRYVTYNGLYCIIYDKVKRVNHLTFDIEKLSFNSDEIGKWLNANVILKEEKEKKYNGVQVFVEKDYKSIYIRT